MKRALAADSAKFSPDDDAVLRSGLYFIITG